MRRLVGALFLIVVLSPAMALAGAWPVPLTWDPPADTTLPVQQYVLRRAPSSTAAMVEQARVAATVLTWSQTLTLPGMACYDVRAQYTGILSEPSNVVCIAIPGIPQTLAVRVVSGVTAGTVTVELSWQLPPVPGTVLTGYKVARATAATGPWTAFATTTDQRAVQDTVHLGDLVCYQVQAVWAGTGAAAAFTALSDPSAPWCGRINLGPPQNLRVPLS